METTLEKRSDPWSTAAIEQNRRWLTAYVLALTGDPGAADDLVQETFAIALSKRDDFQPGTNFGGWLRVIARNVTLRHCERRGREIPLSGEAVLERLDREAARAEAADMNPGDSGTAAALHQCLQKLSARVRRMLDLRYGRGLNSVGIAESVGQTVTAVNVALFRARAALGECIERQGDRL